MDIKKRLNLAKQNTVEILTPKDMEELLTNKPNPSAYLGIAVTGPVHAGYLVPLGKLLDFGAAGIKNTILIADLHGVMDDLKCTWEKMELAANYYKNCVELAFPWKTPPKFALGSSFQLTAEYVEDVFKLSTLTTVNRATRAASEVTRMKNPKVSELIYPIMQALDEEYLDVDVQLGGTDQRHIFGFAREYLPKLGYRPRVEVMTPLTVGLSGPGTKMSASVPSSTIKVHDSEETIRERINRAFCPPGDLEGNPIIQLCKYVIFPLYGRLKIEREKKFGGDIVLKSLEALDRVYTQKKLHPADLKAAVALELIRTFSKARSYFERHRDILQELGERFL